MSVVHYGELQSEKIADENLICRKIVKEIGDFGVNDRQRLFIINLLAMELEDHVLMQEITSLLRERADKKLYLIDNAEETGEE